MNQRSPAEQGRRPSSAFLVHPADPGQVIRVWRDHSGYEPWWTGLTSEAAEQKADNANGGRLAPEVAEAMLVGSMFGWNVPGADPDNYEPGTRVPRRRP